MKGEWIKNRSLTNGGPIYMFGNKGEKEPLL